MHGRSPIYLSLQVQMAIAASEHLIERTQSSAQDSNVIALRGENEIVFPELEQTLTSMLLAELQVFSQQGMNIYDAYLHLKSRLREDLHSLSDRVFSALIHSIDGTDNPGLRTNACTRCPIRLLHYVATLGQVRTLIENNEN
jgi:hypothetical protein